MAGMADAYQHISSRHPAGNRHPRSMGPRRLCRLHTWIFAYSLHADFRKKSFGAAVQACTGYSRVFLYTVQGSKRSQFSGTLPATW